MTKKMSVSDTFPSEPLVHPIPSLGSWGTIPENLGYLSIVGNGLKRIDLARPGFFPNLCHGSELIVVSDYSGEHPGALYDVFSCLVTDRRSLADWEPGRRRVRENWLADGRRIAFKKLKDRQRAQALPEYIDSLANIHGVLLTVALAKEIGSLYTSPLVLHGPPWDSWKTSVLEKVLRVTNVIGLLLAGVARPYQNVLWFTDDDAIAATPEHLRCLSQVFAKVSSLYLQFSLGHGRCTTTGTQRDSSLLIEDLAAVPDLVAGTFGAFLSRTEGQSPDPRYEPILKWISSPKVSVACVFATVREGVDGRQRIEVSTLGQH